jgi:signal transduction histidine kinase
MSLDWDELVPQIAHDLRALVRKGLSNAQFLEKLLGPDTGAEASAHLRAIIESQTDLNRFLIRLVALTDAGSSRHAEEKMDLEMAVLAAKLACRDAIQRSGAELSVQYIPPCSVPESTQIVLKELLDNSLRYGDAVRSLRVVIDAEASHEKIQVRVADNGTGLAPAYTNRLFQPLQRLDATRSGFGLGLAISRAIVEASGGSIYFQPADPGATFVFELPNHPG